MRPCCAGALRHVEAALEVERRIETGKFNPDFPIAYRPDLFLQTER